MTKHYIYIALAAILLVAPMGYANASGAGIEAEETAQIRRISNRGELDSDQAKNVLFPDAEFYLHSHGETLEFQGEEVEAFLKEFSERKRYITASDALNYKLATGQRKKFDSFRREHLKPGLGFKLVAYTDLDPKGRSTNKAVQATFQECMDSDSWFNGGESVSVILINYKNNQ